MTIRVTLERLVLANAVALGVFGLLAAIAPGVVVDGLTAAVPDPGIPDVFGSLALARFLGVACVAMALLLAVVARYAAGTPPARRATATALFLGNGIGALWLLLQQLAIWRSLFGLLCVLVPAVFTVGYGAVTLGATARERRQAGSDPSAGG